MCISHFLIAGAIFQLLKKEAFCTSQGNLAGRRNGFHVSELPKTFQDAVKVVRAVGFQYVCIDSFCIIQSGDDSEDRRRETDQMKHVYSKAHCVIAATAAIDSCSGFLHSHIGSRHFETEHVYVQGNAGNLFYISTDIDDFDSDVVHPGYNDPMRDCIFFLIEGYSRRDITFPKDRLIVILELEDRVAEALFCESRFVTFERFLHRGLMWTVSGENSARIKYENLVPSRSWLSCSGRIDCSKEDIGKIKLNRRIAFQKDRRDALVADLGAFVNCTLKPETDYYVLQDGTGIMKGWLKPDEYTDRREIEQYAVMAVVSNGDGDGDEYRRIGIGEVESSCIVKVQDTVYIV
ncbi:HET-domain-containing protein [Dothidotthia symphoricarpi CBS 119687]|uniref:HET-domain-containing protein n=1 Tax=Dothidotthia symphoricarpi CBS 119687 TaxID=1392245 RepID=A0A6A6APP6_9PLEO|nr:HET-domain-containing protein [Dothidotthia symphoricarpi CBS 119687]KAF2132481.1 HET-domain-containing protein [Dothidotthia symphoricarpi CBS 119687]